MWSSRIIIIALTAFAGPRVLTPVVLAQMEPPSIEWEKPFGGPFGDSATSIERTLDGNFILAGQTYTGDNADLADVLLAKIDRTGRVLWRRAIDSGTGWHDVGIKARAIKDGGFVVLINSSVQRAFGVLEIRNSIVKTNTAGGVIWRVEAEGSIRDVCETVYGFFGVGIVGQAPPKRVEMTDVYLLAVDYNGNVQWERRFGGERNDFGLALADTTEGGYLVGGQTDSTSDELQRGFVARVDSEGNLVWEKILGSSSFEIRAIRRTHDGEFILAGSALEREPIVSRGYLSKVSSSGDVLWTTLLGSEASVQGVGVIESPDGGFVLAGGARVIDEVEGYVAKVDAEGQTIWEKVIPQSYFTPAIELMVDGGYLVAGIRSPVEADLRDDSDVYLAKLAPEELPDYRFLRGDSNRDGKVALDDASSLLEYLFDGGTAPSCPDAADCDDDGSLSISDAIYLLNYLFRVGPPPVDPYPQEGVDVTLDGLQCIGR